MENFIPLFLLKPQLHFISGFVHQNLCTRLSVADRCGISKNKHICTSIRSKCIFFILGVTTLLLGCQGGPLPWDTMAKSQSPQNVLHLEMIKPKTIAAGKDNFIASNGDEILAWGNNSGQKSEPPIIAGKFLDYSAGLNNSIYLTNDGRVLPESDKLTNDPSLYTNLARVISAEDRFFAIKQDGTLINLAAEIIETTGPWGRQSFKIPQEAKNLVDFKPGIGHFVALMADGSVFCWRTSAEITQIKIPAHMTEQYGIIRIAAGAYHSLALRADGKVFAWGDNKNGQTDIPAINKKVVDVAATDETSIALLEDGNLVVWGKPLKEQQLPQDVIELDAKYSQLIVKKRNGKIQVLQAEIPINYAYLYNAKSISGELILDNDGNVHPLLATTPEIPEAARTGIEQIQGRDVELGKYYDLVGSGPVIRFSSPAQPSLPPTGYENYSSPYATLLKPINLTVSKSGHLTLWGSADLSPPTDLGRVTRAQCAMTHCAAIKTNGQVVAWGGNYNGQTNVPTSLTTALDISVGDSFTLAVDSEHKVIGWGGNAYTELNVPRFSRPIKQIEASQFTSMALDDLGNVYSWGGYSSAVISQDPINGEAGPIDSLQQYGALSPNGQVFLPNTYSQVLRTLEYELPIVSIATGGNLISVVDIAGRVDIRGGIRIPADLTELLETTY